MDDYMRVDLAHWNEMVAIHEFPFCGWDCLPNMEKGEDGWHRLKDEGKRKLVPLMFSLRAIKK